MAVTDAPDTAQASSEGDGQDGPEPPHPDTPNTANTTPQRTTPTASNPMAASSPSPPAPKAPPRKQNAPPINGHHIPQPTHKASVPLPPPDHNSHPKQPGPTRHDLAHLVLTPATKQSSISTTASTTPSPVNTPSSESGSWSVPSTRPPSRPPSAPPSQPPSQAPSRAPSMSGPRPDATTLRPGPPHPPTSKVPPSNKKAPPPSSPERPSRSRRSSVNSDGGGKFTLRDLLGNAGPKLSRKSSARSTASSKKSDSEGGRSVAGESTTSLLKKYGICERVAIGKGATSVVRLAHKWDRTEEKLYAVKEFRKRRKNETEKEYVKKLTAEFCISSTLHHVNIVETVDLVQDENQHWCEVMEFCPGGDLYAAIKKGHMAPSEIECCFKQILSGVAYLHSQGVAHRDLKPENIFFDTKGHLKIGDYGASTVYRLPWEATVHMSTGLCGSEPYIAPEQFLGKPYDARLVDIWAVGVVYYCLHFQELPWRVAQPSDPLYAGYISACANPAQTACPPTINNLSPRSCRPLIRRMLEPDPKLRALVDECMNHAWTQGIEVCHAMPNPTHVHVHAQSLANATGPVGRD
ncbi:kinase-like domain-containing protein [Amylostereum chailletii]|nr:kinase-like domain-containing protein [Amylostereum chailletii]